jgi:arylsulfatase A-like enzyme
MTSSVAKLSCLSLLGIGLVAWSCSGKQQQDPTQALQPNILLVVVDTLRADHLSPYGYTENPTTPFLQSLVGQEQMLVVQQVLAPSSWTKPSMATLFTGLPPAEHGVMRLVGAGSTLQDPHTLAAEFSAAGYDTGCVMSNFLLTKGSKSGFDTGFDFYDDSMVDLKNPHRGSTAAKVSEAGIHWLQQRNPTKPWFLVLHYFDPHASFEDHADVDWLDPNYLGWVHAGVSNDVLREHEADCSSADQAALAAFYDEEIHAVDVQVQRVVELLQAQQQWQKTVMVFTADHGEELGERGHIGHTQTLFPELVEVPLLVHVPAAWSAAWHFPEIAGGGFMLSQIYAALLGVAGIELPSGRHAEAPPYATAEVDFRPVRKEQLEKYVQKRLLRLGDFTLIQDQRSGAEELYNHRHDPGFWEPLLADHVQWSVLRSLLAAHPWWEAR